MKLRMLTCGLVLCWTCAALAADADRPVLKLWPDKAPGETGKIGPETMQPPKDPAKPIKVISNVSDPTIALYKPEPAKDCGTAVLVCPGGGYNIVAIGHEGEDVATWLNSLGVTAVVLKYRVPRRAEVPKHLPALQDAQRAMSLARSKAEEWRFDPKRLGILGFSAGGHLAAATTTNGDQRQYKAVDEADKASCRPDFSVLVYPAYLTEGDKLSPEIRVDANTPPVFIVHSADDKGVPIEGSLTLFQALRKAGVPTELHAYAEGGHGYGMNKIGKPAEKWPDACGQWLRSRGLLEKR